MSRITISINPAQLAQAAKLLDDKQLSDAIRRATNRTASTGKTRLSTQIREVLNLKKKVVDERITVKRANYTKADATISVSRLPVPLIEYMTAPQIAAGSRVKGKRGTGVRVRTRKGGKIETLAHTFVNRTPKSAAGQRGVMERRAAGGGIARKGVKRVRRLPTQLRFGPTPVGVIDGKPGLRNKIVVDLSGVFEKNFASQIHYITGSPVQPPR
jgi:hypothetical protein